MTSSKYPEARKWIAFVEKIPFPPEESQRLTTLLSGEGLTEATTADVHQALSALPPDAFKDDWQRAKGFADLNTLLKQWQLSQGKRKFKHSGR